MSLKEKAKNLWRKYWSSPDGLTEGQLTTLLKLPKDDKTLPKDAAAKEKELKQRLVKTRVGRWNYVLGFFVCFDLIFWLIAILLHKHLPAGYVTWSWCGVLILELIFFAMYLWALYNWFTIERLWIIILIIGFFATFVNFTRYIIIEHGYSYIGEWDELLGVVNEHLHVLLPSLFTVIFISVLTMIIGKVIGRLLALETISTSIKERVEQVGPTFETFSKRIVEINKCTSNLEDAIEKLSVHTEVLKLFPPDEIIENANLFSLEQKICEVAKTIKPVFLNPGVGEDSLTKFLCQSILRKYLENESRCLVTGSQYAYYEMYSSYLFYSELVKGILDDMQNLQEKLTVTSEEALIPQGKVLNFFTVLTLPPSRWYNLIQEDSRSRTTQIWQSYTTALSECLRERDKLGNFIFCRCLVVTNPNLKIPDGNNWATIEQLETDLKSYLFKGNGEIPALFQDMQSAKKVLEELSSFLPKELEKHKAVENLRRLDTAKGQKTHLILDEASYLKLPEAAKSKWTNLGQHFIERFHSSKPAARYFEATPKWYEDEEKQFRTILGRGIPDDLFAIGISEPDTVENQDTVKPVDWKIFITLDSDASFDKIYLRFYRNIGPVGQLDPSSFERLADFVDYIRPEADPDKNKSGSLELQKRIAVK